MIVVAKKVRLLSKDEKGFFKLNGQQEVVRNCAKISIESVKESESNCAETGLVWIVDEEATAQRNEPVKESKPDLTELRAKYKELAKTDAKGNWGANKLNEEIEKLLNQ